jgi:hypothetical protein
MKRFLLAAVLPVVVVGVLASSVSRAGDDGKVSATTAVNNEAKPTYELRSRRAPGALDRVEVLLEVGGNVRIADVHATTDKPSLEKISTVAKFAYDEKTLAVAEQPGSLRSIRHYDQGEAVIKVGDTGLKPELRKSRRLIGVDVSGAKIAMFSPEGPLTGDELQLIDFPGNSLIVDRLLPDHPVAIGDSWKQPESVVAALCGLEVVAQSDVRSMLKDVIDGSARIEMSGRVTGKNTGRSVTIVLKAKQRFDLKTARVTWLGLLLKEDSSTGPIKTGLDVAGKLQLRISPLADSASLSDAALKGLSLRSTPELEQLVYVAPDGGWDVRHDRRWWVMHPADKSRAEFRLVDQGEPLADCSIATMAKTDASKAMTLAEFQDDVRQGLGKDFGQFVHATQKASTSDYRVYSVAVHGVQNEVPIRWLYYRIADKLGRQAVLVFTLKEADEDRFDRIGEHLVDGFRFVDATAAKDAKEPAKPDRAGQGD